MVHLIAHLAGPDWDSMVEMAESELQESGEALFDMRRVATQHASAQHAARLMQRGVTFDEMFRASDSEDGVRVQSDVVSLPGFPNTKITWTARRLDKVKQHLMTRTEKRQLRGVMHIYCSVLQGRFIDKWDQLGLEEVRRATDGSSTRRQMSGAVLSGFIHALEDCSFQTHGIHPLFDKIQDRWYVKPNA
jgi:hypothetical protein